MTYVDVRRLTSPQAAALGADALGVVQVGACEQHGPHLPFYVDTFLCTAVAEGVERALPEQVLLLALLPLPEQDLLPLPLLSR